MAMHSILYFSLYIGFLHAKTLAKLQIVMGNTSPPKSPYKDFRIHDLEFLKLMNKYMNKILFSCDD